MADGMLVYTDDPIVSSDIVGIGGVLHVRLPPDDDMGSMVKVFGWYDNEWGYSTGWWTWPG